MKSMLLSLLIIATFHWNCSAQSQPFSCKHSDPSPEALHRMHALRGAEKSTDTKIIPIVFHVLHQNGSENITDAQILNAMDSLNLDWKRLNFDTINVAAPFDTIIGKANFEFRLATIDPNGNPTTGIDHICTPLTNVGDETAMINEWDNLRYVNIWVTNITIPGVSGFSTNPISNPDACVQGILLLNDFIGSIGTGNFMVRHALSHEMGHYFGLFHTWGDQTDPGQSCAYSDGIYDTPKSEGNDFCNLSANSCDDTNDPESFAYWGFDVRDNIENFMEFSYCTFMFTKGQVELIRAVAESPDYGRNYLWTEENLIATGTGPGIPPISTAAPGADFSVYSNLPNTLNIFGMKCVNDPVTFSLENGNPQGTTYAWSFPGGNPSTSTITEPVITYASPGYYDVTLTATNNNGSATTTKTGIMFVSGPTYDYNGPTLIEFNNAPNWISQNNEFDSGNFEQIPNSGVSNSGCFKLDNHFEIDSSALCDFNFEDQLITKKDNLITPAFNLSTSTNVTVSYDLAYGSSALNGGTEMLKVYSSKDCGNTWTQRQILQNTSLISANVLNSDNYVPAANDWTHHTFNYTTSATDTKTRFKFEFTASNNSNNLYLDNFEINGILGISTNEESAITVFPNPLKQGAAISVSGLSGTKATIVIRDLQGKLVHREEVPAVGGDGTIQLAANLSAGCYLVEVFEKNNELRTRLIVE